jgi:hypothetical protein
MIEATARSLEASKSLVDAARIRQHRLAVAQLLSNIPSRADVEWDDLTAVPTWALTQPESALTIQILRIGAWAHLTQLRRCIDGRLLGHLVGLLGQQEVDRLLQSEPFLDEFEVPLRTMPDALSGRDAADLHQHLIYVGQWMMLLSITRQRVRRAVAQALWPHLPYLQKDRVPDDMSHTLALAVMRAQHLCHEREGA